ncbi:hypothetical protein Cflav_PD6361 [Pedosphaera parvula Ellin514]|uniref:Uncharacterized protein n=2 Tax=Pedosphaera TaxID=1032526 RepID=B9XDE0_PEDPL|nr:hypothetical protein Cflav_PD6361 [Pedosphaera parvula Ellin514]
MELLPEPVREQVNLKILNGTSLRAILAWLRGSGYGQITYMKLWWWYQANYQAWLNRREFSAVFGAESTASSAKHQNKSPR